MCAAGWTSGRGAGWWRGSSRTASTRPGTSRIDGSLSRDLVSSPDRRPHVRPRRNAMHSTRHTRRSALTLVALGLALAATGLTSCSSRTTDEAGRAAGKAAAKAALTALSGEDQLARGRYLVT